MSDHRFDWIDLQAISARPGTRRFGAWRRVGAWLVLAGSLAMVILLLPGMLKMSYPAWIAIGIASAMILRRRRQIV